jgi:hypothetical protein
MPRVRIHHPVKYSGSIVLIAREKILVHEIRNTIPRLRFPNVLICGGSRSIQIRVVIATFSLSALAKLRSFRARIGGQNGRVESCAYM